MMRVRRAAPPWILQFAVLLHHCVLPSITLAQLAATDLAALKAIHSWLHDVAPPNDGPRFFDSWDFSKDPCSFEGVLCDGVAQGGCQRVAALNLGVASGNSAGLHGRLHPALGSLWALVQLSLAPGKVGGSIPSTLSHLTRLENLGLSHNLLTGSIPSSLGQLRRLTSLDLAFNRLSGGIPTELAALPNLVSLRVAHNRLTGALPPSFAETPLLEHLDASRNSLGGGVPVLPPSLSYLNLARNQVRGGLGNLLGNIKGLVWVDLSQNQLSGDVPPSLLSAPQLAYLSLQRNSLSGAIAPLQLVVISTLDLSFNQLSGPISPFLAFTRNLYLNNNRFTGSVPQEFVDELLSSAMHTLFLQQNFLTNFPLSPALSLPLSATVCVQYNCMVQLPSLQHSPCPHNAGHLPFSRPSTQCKST